MGLIGAAVQATEDGTPVTIKQLAKGTSADTQLIIRLMRVLRVIHMFRESRYSRIRSNAPDQSPRN
ncbi:hypothetical protein BDV19DRAFT_394133 [Aspergillus venezuelensis]